jgi:hypothetical protein
LQEKKKRKYIFIISAFVLSFIIIAGVFLIKPLANNQIIINSNDFDTEIKTVIESYVGYAVQNNWNKALNYLRGEAYLITKTNLQNYNGQSLKLVSINIYNVISSSNFAIADLEVVSSHDNITYNKYFRYYLYKDKNWQIFSIDTPNKPIYSGSYNKYDFNSIIKNYLDDIQNKQYNKAFELLTTPALENGQNNMLSPDSIDITSEFNNVKIQELYNKGNNVFLYVTYTVNTTIKDKSVKKDMSYIFEIDNVNGKWLISNIKLL